MSLRTIYRDIATLIAQGADIAGEAGVGYILRPGFLLPPLMFDDDEIEALILGLRFVAQRGDDALGLAARNAAAKIVAVLPHDLAEAAEHSGLLAGPGPGLGHEKNGVDLALLRESVRTERKLRLTYEDRGGKRTERIVWPVALGFFDHAQVLSAWCETRLDFRHFRTDRMLDAQLLGDRYPRRRAALLREWQALEGIRSQL